MNKFLVYDIEANGLYNDYYKDNATHIWCIVVMDEDEEVEVFVKDDLVRECSYDCNPLSTFRNWLNHKLRDLDGLVCHNQINYDLRMLDKFCDIPYSIYPGNVMGHNVEIIDTFIDSKWLNPKRPLPKGCPGSIVPEDGGKNKIIGPHGLAAWGYKVQKKKPEIEDWEGLHIDKYVERCIEDVHINFLVFEELNNEIAKYFNGARDIRYWKKNRDRARTPITIEHAFKQDIIEQEDNGVPFNEERARDLLPIWDKELSELRGRIESHLPPVVIPPSRLVSDWKFPAKPFKQDKKHGAVPSSSLEKFCIKHGGENPVHPWKDESGDWWVDIEVDGERKKYKAPFPDFIKTQEQMTVESEHLSQYIIDTYGWKPMYWNYKIDPKTKRKVRDAKGNLIPTSPRFKDAQSGRLCPHLESLDVPFIRDVLRYRTIKHRRQTISSTTNDVKGYLNHPRLKIDGRLPAGMDTVGAATSRVTHRVVCNVPGADEDKLYGKELRELFYANDPDFLALGYDASGLEARLEGSEAALYDGGEYAKVLTEEDIHQLNADYFGIKRSPAKNIKYGLGYGAGAGKVGEMLNVSYESASQIIEDWWEKYWAVKKVIDHLQAEYRSTGNRYITGIDGRPIQMTSPHLALNYRLQNAGTVVMKLHAVLMYKETMEYKKKGLVQKVIDYHDEAMWLVHKSLVKFYKVDSEEKGLLMHEKHKTTKPFVKDGQLYVAYCKIGVMGCNAITKAGQKLGIRVPLTGEYKLGRSWADVH